MLTLVVAIKWETPCESELLLFAGMNDHLHAAGLLEHLIGGEPSPRKSGMQSTRCLRYNPQDESGVYIIARLREHVTSLTFRAYNVHPDNRGQS